MNELKKYINDTDTEEIRIFQEDIISVKHKKENPHQIDPSKHWLATNLIAEEKEGRQVWIGKVIGKNQRYIHFRDNSKRSWVDVKGFENQIEIGDYCFWQVKNALNGHQKCTLAKPQYFPSSF